MNKKQNVKPFLLSVFSYFTIGCMVLTANTVMKSIIQENHWLDSQGAMLITCMSMGNLIMSILGNALMEKTGRRAALMLYSVMLCLSFILFAAVPAPGLYYAFLFVAGLAWGGINSLSNTVVTEMYDGEATHLNVMHACYAVGAVLFPLLMGFLTMNGASWRIPVLVVAALGAALAVASALIKLPERKPTIDSSGKAVQVAFWREPGFYLAVMTFFMYVGVESSASSWLSMYLNQENPFFAEKVPAETMVSLMWLTILIGRVTFSFISGRMNQRVLLVGLSTGFLVGMAGIVTLSASTPLAILSVAITGLSMSAMYATAVACYAHYVECSAIAPGIMFGAGGLGSALIPFVAGLISDHAGLKMGMGSLCLFLVLLVAAAGGNLLLHRSSDPIQ